MAIDDNTSYELTGAQVKDLANKIKAKAADNIFVGATSAAPGSKGLVPQPQAGDDTKFLSGDGTWKTVSSGSNLTILYADDIIGPFWDNKLYTDAGHTHAVTHSEFLSIVESCELGIYDEDGDEVYLMIEASGNYAFFVDGGRDGFSISIDRDDQTQLLYVVESTAWKEFEGATSSQNGSNGLVPAPASGDQDKVLHGDGTWKDATAKLVEMSYGESNAWAKFIAAYNAGSIVYCRASSNANPGTGSQTRKAFMAYVNNASNPTSVEFQYVRSNSSKSDSSQCDQVFVYTLTSSNGGTWSVASRDMAPKINVDSTLTKTFSSGANASMTLGAKTMTGATSSTAGAAGAVPAPAAGDEGKVLTGAGAWTDLVGSYSTSEVATPYTWVDGSTIYKQTIKTDNVTQVQTVVTHGISNFGALVNAEGVMYTAGQGYQPLNRVLPHLMSTWGWGLGDVQATTFTLFFGSSYTLSEITTWITLYYTKSV